MWLGTPLIANRLYAPQPDSSRPSSPCQTAPPSRDQPIGNSSRNTAVAIGYRQSRPWPSRSTLHAFPAALISDFRFPRFSVSPEWLRLAEKARNVRQLVTAPMRRSAENACPDPGMSLYRAHPHEVLFLLHAYPQPVVSFRSIIRDTRLDVVTAVGYGAGCKAARIGHVVIPTTRTRG